MLELRSHTPKGRRAHAQVLATAEAVFAERGFHAASMRDLADAAGVPLATLVYHFARKEQLYAAVLAVIAAQLDADLDRALASPLPPAAAVDAFLHALVAWAIREPQRVRLLLRELLDNPPRLATAASLPLAPFLTRTTALVAAAARAGVATAPLPELAVLQLVGGISYVVASRPTVERIVGKTRAKQLAAGLSRDAIAFAHRALGLVLPEGRRAR